MQARSHGWQSQQQHGQGDPGPNFALQAFLHMLIFDVQDPTLDSFLFVGTYAICVFVLILCFPLHLPCSA